MPSDLGLEETFGLWAIRELEVVFCVPVLSKTDSVLIYPQTAFDFLPLSGVLQSLVKTGLQVANPTEALLFSTDNVASWPLGSCEGGLVSD